MSKGRKPAKPKATKKAKPKKVSPQQQTKQPFAVLPPSLDIRKIGRPSKYDPSFCELVLDLGSEGKSRAQIAAAIGVDRDTLREWAKQYPEFSVAIKGAKELELAWWENAGQINMTRQGFNATAFIFQMKNRFREDYRDTQALEHTGKNGGPLGVSNADIQRMAELKRMTDEELDELIRQEASAIVEIERATKKNTAQH
jgi:hypothetical protein